MNTQQPAGIRFAKLTWRTLVLCAILMLGGVLALLGPMMTDHAVVMASQLEPMPTEEVLPPAPSDPTPAPTQPPAASEEIETGELVIARTDTDGNPVIGSCFAVFDSSGHMVAEACDEDGLASDGITSFSGLPPGRYTVVETRVPPGYEPAADDTAEVIAGAVKGIVVQSATLPAAPTAVVLEPVIPVPVTVLPEEDQESSIKVVVRWCPFGTELGGPRMDHPLIEKLCTLDGPEIKVDLLFVPDGSIGFSDAASAPFPSGVNFTPVKPGIWNLTFYPGIELEQSLLYCATGSEYEVIDTLRPQPPQFEIEVGDTDNLECHWYGEPTEEDEYTLVITMPGSLKVFKFYCEGPAEELSRAGLKSLLAECTEDPGHPDQVGASFSSVPLDAMWSTSVTEHAEPGDPAPFPSLPAGQVRITESGTDATLIAVACTNGSLSELELVELAPSPSDQPSWIWTIEEFSESTCYAFNHVQQKNRDDLEKRNLTGAAEITILECKGTPPRDAGYGWFNKNCAAATGPSLELSNGEKDGNVPLQPARSPVGYAVNKEVAPGSYLLTQSGGTPLNAYSVWCATLKPDQMPSPSDYVQIPITRAGVSITVHDGAWTSCKVFGPATRGSSGHTRLSPALTFFMSRHRN